MATALDIIRLALKASGIIGVGQTPNAEDTNDAFTLMNMMISQWNRDRPIVYHLQELSVACDSRQYYTFGPAGDFNVAQRPDRIAAAFIRLTTQSNPNQVDYPLAIIDSFEDYSTITLKQLNSFPQGVWMDTSYEVAKVYPWPIPNNQYALHLIFKAPLARFATLPEQVSFPPEYEEALLYNLACRLCVNFQMPLPPELEKRASTALNIIKNANTQIPVMSMPGSLVTTGVYNIYSDRYTR